ncbi:MAG: response regulator transcription factor [Chloroflexi bacterium]|nr:response regulator transcription factor [Chloroflexota bacterium]
MVRQMADHQSKGEERRPDTIVPSFRPGCTKVLIVEDEPLFRDLLKTTLCSYGQIQVVGAVDNGIDAIELAEETLPDVILMDIELGSEPDGIRAAHQIKAANPAVGIVILSMHREKEYLASLPESRAAGWSYMLKQSLRDKDALVRAIEGSSWGLVTIDPALLESLKPRSRSVLERLTQPQLMVLEKIAAGYSDAAICEQMGFDSTSLARLTALVYEDLGIPTDGPTDPRVKATLTYLNETTTSGNSMS